LNAVFTKKRNENIIGDDIAHSNHRFVRSVAEIPARLVRFNVIH
jgi:hypothetical protein